MNAKYDEELASQCLAWVRDLVNMNGANDPVDFNVEGKRKNFSAVLHDGLLLARLAEVVLPGSIPASKLRRGAPSLAFKQMELIELFIQTCRQFGVSDEERFQTVDLYEEQNLHQVLLCLQALSRKAKARGLPGFGPAESGPNRRTFDEGTLRAGQGIIGLQMGTNKGASQAGMNFGKTRSILD